MCWLVGMTETYALSESWTQIREEVLERDGYECQYCNVGEPVAALEVHHIVPVRLNGSDELDNLITLCCRCHKSLHVLGDGPEYPVDVLEAAEGEEIGENPLNSRQIDARYKDNTPVDYSQEEWAEQTADSEAPARATLTVKHIDGLDHYYWQWREGGRVKSEYIGRSYANEQSVG